MSFTKTLRITIPLVMYAAVLCLLTSPVSAQRSGGKKNIVDFRHLITVLENAKSDKTRITTITEVVKEYGVDFQLTPEMENTIRSSGSYLSKESLDDLVSAVRDNYRSIEHVMSFVKGKLSDSRVGYTVLSGSIEYSYNDVEVGRCKLSWQQKRTVRWHDSNKNPDPITFRFEINLSDIDPEQIRLEQSLKEPEIWSIIMTTTNSEKKIKSNVYETSLVSNSEVIFSDKTLAERVSAALKEWVKGCGGKTEPY